MHGALSVNFTYKYTSNIVSSQKYVAPFLHTTLSQKWEGDICLNIQLVSYIPLPPYHMVVRHVGMTTKKMAVTIKVHK